MGRNWKRLVMKYMEIGPDEEMPKAKKRKLFGQRSGAFDDRREYRKNQELNFYEDRSCVDRKTKELL